MKPAANIGYMPYQRIDRVVTAHSRSVMPNFQINEYKSVRNE